MCARVQITFPIKLSNSKMNFFILKLTQSDVAHTFVNFVPYVHKEVSMGLARWLCHQKGYNPRAFSTKLSALWFFPSYKVTKVRMTKRERPRLRSQVSMDPSDESFRMIVSVPFTVPGPPKNGTHFIHPTWKPFPSAHH